MTENLIENAATPGVVATSQAAPVAVGDNLFASLGLDKVEADPNAIPDGRYDAVVASARLVHKESNGQVSFVITYQVTDGDNKGARVPHFFPMGVNPTLNEKGEILSYTPTQTEQNKQWFKKAFVDLGIPEQIVHTVTPEALVGRECTIGVRKRDGYRNVTFVEARGNSIQAQQAMTGVSAAPNAAVQAMAQSPSEPPPF